MALKKSVSVLWSGGLDSTAMIWHYLNEGWAVNAYYVEIVNNDKKVVYEQAAIERMLPFLKQRKNFNYLGVACKTDINQFSREEGPELKQIPSWLFTAWWLPSPVAIAYVMNDCAISWLPEIKSAAKALSKLRKEPLHLLFPMIKKAKSELWKDLPDELRNNVVWCENPNIDLRLQSHGSCRECPPCKRMAQDGYVFPEVSVDAPDSL